MANTTTYSVTSQVVPFPYDLALARAVQSFLATLQGNGQPALETLPVPAAVDLSGIEVTE